MDTKLTYWLKITGVIIVATYAALSLMYYLSFLDFWYEGPNNEEDFGFWAWVIFGSIFLEPFLVVSFLLAFILVIKSKISGWWELGTVIFLSQIIAFIVWFVTDGFLGFLGLALLTLVIGSIFLHISKKWLKSLS